MITPTRPRRARTGLIVAASAAAVGLLGFGAWTAVSNSDGRLGASGPAMAIALIAPREPVPVEGPEMTVGALNDGFDRAALDRRPETIDVDYLPPDAYVGDTPTLDLPYERSTPVVQQAVAVEAPPPANPLADGSRWFGLDRQRPAASIPAAQGEAKPSAAPEPGRRSEDFFQ